MVPHTVVSVVDWQHYVAVLKWREKVKFVCLVLVVFPEAALNAWHACLISRRCEWGAGRAGCVVLARYVRGIFVARKSGHHYIQLGIFEDAALEE